jgi:hypothetical protein
LKDSRGYNTGLWRSWRLECRRAAGKEEAAICVQVLLLFFFDSTWFWVGFLVALQVRILPCFSSVASPHNHLSHHHRTPSHNTKHNQIGVGSRPPPPSVFKTCQVQGHFNQRLGEGPLAAVPPREPESQRNAASFVPTPNRA